MENNEPKKHPFSKQISETEFAPVDSGRLTDKIMRRVELDHVKAPVKVYSPFGFINLLRWSSAVVSIVLIVAFFQEYNAGFEPDRPIHVHGEKAIILNSSAYMPRFSEGDSKDFAQFFREKIQAKEDRKEFWSKLREKYEEDN